MKINMASETKIYDVRVWYSQMVSQVTFLCNAGRMGWLSSDQDNRRSFVFKSVEIHLGD